MPLLEVRDLSVHIGALQPLDRIAFSLDKGRILGLVGESGSGKSLTAMALMGLLPLIGGRVSHGSVKFDGTELVGLADAPYRALRGHRIALITQNPMTSLDPMLKVGEQIDQVARMHLGLTAAAAKARSIELLTQLRIPDAATVHQQYPHQMSGGMKQRVVIAMALAGEPELIIADEPTTALDVTIQAQIIQILVDLVRRRSLALVLITHDMGVVAQACDEVVVLYAGRVAESQDVQGLFAHPAHPYTRALIACIPRSGQAPGSLQGIAGMVPSVSSYASGCRYHPRCPHAEARCQQEVPALQAQAASRVACHFASPGVGMADATPPLVQARALTRVFTSRASLFGRKRVLTAVNEVDLDVPRGRVTGVVGESGCGKSTLARLVLRLLPASAGSVHFDGTDLASVAPAALRTLRRRMQMVFQDPYSSIDPRYSVRDALREPMQVQGVRLDGAAQEQRVAELMAMVGLNPTLAGSYPHQLSGGQKQRVGIARALALQPDFLVLDEPTASLDVSIQAQIVALLEQLQRDLGLTYLFISHDLGLVRYFCDRIVVMYLGRVVEILPTADAAPRHPYTRALMDSTFEPDPQLRRVVTLLHGEIPDAFDLPRGCAYAARCPNASARCREARPPLTQDADHSLACHHPLA